MASGCKLEGYRRALVAILAALAALSLALLASAPARGANNFPSGFSETLVDNGLSSPTAMAFAPDGRIFVTEQGGRVRVIKDGNLLAQPFADISSKVDSRGERGLLGIAFDPDFAQNNYVYAYYTLAATQQTPVHNRIVRFTAATPGDVAVADSEQLVMRLDDLSSATNHNGGAIHFAADGKLYVAVGDNANGSNAQSLGTRHGKILRINKDGTIPADNPFFALTTRDNRAIWARGLRNPYSFDVKRGTKRLFINDVGQSAWEEINRGIPKANYGWPASEGPNGITRRFTKPVHFYGHGNSNSTGCAITGGSFYDPMAQRFPERYAGDYFYADFCSGWIRVYDPATDRDRLFATNVSNPVDLEVSTDGYLYYLARGSGAVYRVGYTTP
jgi:glucose/arabinose dehydrogenase